MFYEWLDRLWGWRAGLLRRMLPLLWASIAAAIVLVGVCGALASLFGGGR